MKLLQFLNFFKSDKSDDFGYIPILWEDDYCQIELIPREIKYLSKSKFMKQIYLLNNIKLSLDIQMYSFAKKTQSQLLQKKFVLII